MYIFEKERKYRTKLRDREGNRDYSQEYFDDAKARRMQTAKTWRGARQLSDNELRQIEDVMDSTDFYYAGANDSYEPNYCIEASVIPSRKGPDHYDDVMVTIDAEIEFPEILKDEGIDDPDELERIRSEIKEDYESLLNQDRRDNMFKWIANADSSLIFAYAFVDWDKIRLTYETYLDTSEAKTPKSFVIMARRALVAILKKLDKRMYIAHKNLIKQYI